MMAPVTHLARAERYALCETFLAVGPDAPTLCSPWRSRDLAAHLILRESRPDLSAGIVIRALAGRLERTQHDRAMKDWPDLVRDFRQGPPMWSPARLGIVDDATNLTEFYIHHEDVLRAADEPVSRELDPGLEAALWSSIKRHGPLAVRRSPVGVVLVAEGHGRAAVMRPGTGGTVVLHGAPGELVLHLSGRQDHARVHITGEHADVSAFEQVKLGI